MLWGGEGRVVDGRESGSGEAVAEAVVGGFVVEGEVRGLGGDDGGEKGEEEGGVVGSY